MKRVITGRSQVQNRDAVPISPSDIIKRRTRVYSGCVNTFTKLHHADTMPMPDDHVISYICDPSEIFHPQKRKEQKQKAA